MSSPGNVGRCPEGMILVSENYCSPQERSFCISATEEPITSLSWDAARNYCRSQYSGGDIPTRSQWMNACLSNDNFRSFGNIRFRQVDTDSGFYQAFLAYDSNSIGEYIGDPEIGFHCVVDAEKYSSIKEAFVVFLGTEPFGDPLNLSEKRKTKLRGMTESWLGRLFVAHVRYQIRTDTGFIPDELRNVRWYPDLLEALNMKPDAYPIDVMRKINQSFKHQMQRKVE